MGFCLENCSIKFCTVLLSVLNSFFHYPTGNLTCSMCVEKCLSFEALFIPKVYTSHGAMLMGRSIKRPFILDIILLSEVHFL